MIPQEAGKKLGLEAESSAWHSQSGGGTSIRPVPAAPGAALCVWRFGKPKGEGRPQNAGLPAGRGSQHKFWSWGRPGSKRSEAGRAHQREASDLHQHRFRDALQTSRCCWALREPTRKEKAGEQAGRGRERARGCARPPARSRRRRPGPGRARDGGGSAGSSLSFPPPPFPSHYWKNCVGETQKHPDFRTRGGGGPGSRWCSKENQKCICSRRFNTRLPSGGSWVPQPRLPLQPPKISLRHPGGRVAQEGTERRVRKCHDFFSCALPDTAPAPSFLVLPLPLGKGLMGFASKNCIYSVLLGEARKHPGRQDSGMKQQQNKNPQSPRPGCTSAGRTPRRGRRS